MSMILENIKKTVVMGGGTGTYCVISALKQLNVEIASVIAVSDSGGSTGRIRDEFGFQPVGDLRQSLAAMADPESQEWIQKILLYRFTKGKGLKGHNLGNLLLTALQDMTNDTGRALSIAEKIFNLNGTVIPVTTKNVNLKITYKDGSEVIGEHILDEKSPHPKQIAFVSLVPECQLNAEADAALRAADVIIIGPGDFYASLMASVIADGTKEAFAASNARIVYITNLMTRRTQTHGMTASDHVSKIESVIGRRIGTILVNNQPIPKETLAMYARAEEFPVTDDLGNRKGVVRSDLISTELSQQSKADTAYRSLLRHDSNKLRTVLKKVLKNT